MRGRTRVLDPAVQEGGDEVRVDAFVTLPPLHALVRPQEGEPRRRPQVELRPQMRLLPSEGVKLRDVEKRLFGPWKGQTGPQWHGREVVDSQVFHQHAET